MHELTALEPARWLLALYRGRESGLASRLELGAAAGLAGRNGVGLGLLVGEGGIAAVDLLVPGLAAGEVGGEEDHQAADDEHRASREDVL